MDNSQEATTNAPATAAPAPEATQTTAAPVPTPATTTEQTTPAAAPAQAEPVAQDDKPDYSKVPSKFLRPDGTPDLHRLADSYSALEKKIHSKAGLAPESLDDYLYEAKNFQSSEEEAAGFKEFAKDISLSPKQYEAVMSKYDEIIGATTVTEAMVQQHLEQTWGDEYQRNVGFARKAFDAFAPSSIGADVLGTNPHLVEFLARVGAEMGEDKTPSRAASQAGMTREDAMALMARPEYRQRTPEGDRIRAEVDSWYSKNASKIK